MIKPDKPGKAASAAIRCDNCRRIVQPAPVRVVLMVEGRLHSERLRKLGPAGYRRLFGVEC